MSHTKDKIIIRDNYGPVLIIDGKQYRHIAAVLSEDMDISKDSASENARRLVACWNACEGIPLPELEFDKPTFAKMLLERQTLKKERDELLKVLRKISDSGGEFDLPLCAEIDANLGRYKEEE